MGDTPKPTERLKVGLVVSGAIALGSFESGVICELTRAARAKNGPIEIDLIAGTSAGSITGAQVAKALLAENPDFHSFQLWEEATLKRLTKRNEAKETSPLSQSWIKERIESQLAPKKPPTDGLLDDTGAPYEKGDPPQKVRLVVTMTDLEGDTHGTSLGEGINVPVEGCWNSVTVSTDLTPGTDNEQWKRIGELVRASSAHSAAWEAVRLDMDAAAKFQEHWEPKSMYDSLVDRQRRSGEQPFFVDGGTVASANLPVGRALRMLSRGDDWKAVPQIPYDPYRLILYVEPDPETRESRPGDYEKWLLTAKQASSIYSSSAVPHGDLKWIGETNEQIVDDLTLLYQMGSFLIGALPVEKKPELTLDVQTLPFPFNLIAGPLQQAAPGWDQIIRSWLPPEATKEGNGEATETETDEATGKRKPEDSVEAFYQWLDDHGNTAAPDQNEQAALAALEAYMASAPLGSAPYYKGNLGANYAGGYVTAEIAKAIRNVAELYYTFKLTGHPELVEILVGLHKWIASHTPAGDRQWVCVTRISPSCEKPYSRALGHFGGFLNQEWMRYDFILGRRRAIAWLREKFPEHDYVKNQLRLMPPLPKVETQAMEPKLVARNAAPLTTIIQEVQKSAYEALPWLNHWPAKAISYVLSSYLVAATVYVTGKFALLQSLWAWMKPFMEKAHLFLGIDWVAVSGLAGLAGVAWWNRRPLQRRIRFLIFLWGVVVWGRKLWETSKEALWPSRSPAAPTAQVAAAKQTDQGQ